MSDRIRLGMIGCGGIARWHMQRLCEIPEVEIVALTDTSKASIAKLKKTLPKLRDVPVYSDYRQMLDKTAMDAAEIATPHTLHFQQAMDCLDRGLHLLIEKPMACRVDHAKKLIDHAKEKDRIVVLSYQRHYSPQFRYMKDVIGEGRLGEVTFISALQCQQWKHLSARTWRQDPELSGGGQLNDSGSHLVDIILWVTGLGVEEVFTYTDCCGTRVDVNSALSLKFRNGAQGTLSVVGDALCWHEDLTIWGEKGILFYRNGQLTECGPDGKPVEPTDTAKSSTPTSNPDKNLIDAILGRDIVWAPPVCGLRVIELTAAAWKSAELGAPVRVESL